MKKLFVVAHKDVFIPASDILVPINPNDTNVENIAEKWGYSELRSHYQVWKDVSIQADVVGFFQFRRYLDITAPLFTCLSSEKRPLPYKTAKFPQGKNYSETLLKAICNFDVIAPIREYTGVSVRKRYAKAEGQRDADLCIVYEIISEQYPEYLPAANIYLNGTGEYYGNLYIMRRSIFDSYCSWLFSILGEYDSRVASIPPRTQGYLAERLFGIWFTRAYTEDLLKCAELPRLHFWGYDDETHNLRRDNLINTLLPPGTQLRADIRKLVR